MDSITATIITKNEERNIERCLTSLRGVVDEIVVVDSFSTDQTKAICKKFNARFYESEWQGYSKTKNLANSLAENEYILSIDADEALSEALKKSIISAKANGLKGNYSFHRLTNYCGKWIKHAGWYPDTKIRIFPKSQTRWQGEIHEELVFDQEFQNHFLAGDLLHYSYYDFKEHRRRADHYSRLTARKLFDNGKRVGVLRPILSYIGRFVKMYFLKSAILDGYHGFKLSQISAESNVVKYKELRRLQKEAQE